MGRDLANRRCLGAGSLVVTAFMRSARQVTTVVAVEPASAHSTVLRKNAAMG
jgi:predicted RNA methylase